DVDVGTEVQVGHGDDRRHDPAPIPDLLEQRQGPLEVLPGGADVRRYRHRGQDVVDGFTSRDSGHDGDVLAHVDSLHDPGADPTDLTAAQFSARRGLPGLV